jgi:spore coat polysaccharide biosynthesis protein SpsF
MKRVIVIQARMTSSRLPGKVLHDLAGRPMLAQQLRRLKAMREADEFVVATTDLPTDDPVVDLARREGVRVFRGNEHDVLARFVGAARDTAADIVARITADCPLIDAAEADRVVRELREHSSEADYASNVLRRTFPRGLDVEALFRDALERMQRLATSSKSREHVTWYLRTEAPELFKTRSVEDAQDNSDLRWTVDTAEDLAEIRRIYEGCELATTMRPYREILAYVRAQPAGTSANVGVIQKDP